MVSKQLKTQQKSSLNNLLHGEGTVLYANVLAEAKTLGDFKPYKDWAKSFADGFRGVRLKDTFLSEFYQSRFNSIASAYAYDEEAIYASTEFRQLINNLRYDEDSFLTADNQSSSLTYFLEPNSNKLATDTLLSSETTAEQSSAEALNSTNHFLGVAIGFAVGSISALLKYKSIGTWSKQERSQHLALIGSSFVKGALAGAIPFYIINQLQTPTHHFVEKSLSKLFNENLPLAEDSLIKNFAIFSGSYFIIMSAITVRMAINSSYDLKNLGLKGAIVSVSEPLKRIALEQASFSSLHFFLRGFASWSDSAITLWVLGLRLAYSVGKISLAAVNQKKVYQKSMDSLYESARIALQ